MSELAQRSTHHVSGWVGWIGFAGIIMVLSGILQAISGLVGIFSQTFYAVGNGSGQLLVIHDVHTWGWVNLIVGLVVMFAGFSLFSGSTWARVVAVLFAMGSIIVNVVDMPLYPLWSILAVTLSVIVIFAVMAHGRELSE